jgi:hypothetical protein
VQRTSGRAPPHRLPEDDREPARIHEIDLGEINDKILVVGNIRQMPSQDIGRIEVERAADGRQPRSALEHDFDLNIPVRHEWSLPSAHQTQTIFAVSS